MNYKVEKIIKDNKKYAIVFLILWLILELFLVAPIAVSVVDSKVNGTNFIETIMAEISSFKSITKVFNSDTIGVFGKTSLWTTIILLVFFIIGIIKSKPKHDFKDIEHGSSDWSEGGEQYKILSKNKGIILAEKNYLPIDKRGNVNVLVVGGSGSGKSASYSIPNAYQMLGSYVFTDPKGELYDRTAGYLKEHGYDIKILNLVDPKNSDGYNPLFNISNNIDVDVIASTIVRGQQGEGGKSDPYWDDMAEMLLKALIYYLLATRPREEQSLASCAELVRAANASGGSNVLTDLMNQLPFDHPARMNYKSIEIAPEKTYGSILSTLQSKLGKFDSQEIADVTSTNTINFEDIANKKTALYVVSSDTHTAYNFLLTIFFSQMIQHLYDYADKNGGKLNVPVFFILDEFANIGQIPDFDKKISTSRSRKISFSVILQNLDQLKAVYEKSYETIVGNCDTHVFLGSNSAETCEYFSKQLGEKTITRDNLSVNRDKQYHRQGLSTSDQIMARALMTPDELRRMDNSLCIIFEKGLRPIKANKFYYFEKPMVKELAKAEIDHNDFNAGVRGVWRKFNPNNPYVDGMDNSQEQNLNIESLDDLFDEDEFEKKNQSNAENMSGPQVNNDMASSDSVQKNENINDSFKNNQEAPTLPMEDNTKEDELFNQDLQKELEAKFDELFGPIDDDNNEN